MARTINEQDYIEKRNEIIAAAQRLVYTRGYEQMSIKDIIEELQISKGAFYHYFSSKQSLLEGLINRMRQEGEQLLFQILDDANLAAIEKLQRFFDTVGRWKTAQKSYILRLLRVWYADDNAIVRQKMNATAVEHVTPLLSRVITEGVREGQLNTPFPDQAGAIVLTLLQGMGDTLTRMLLSCEPRQALWPHAEQLIAAYNDALERVLGAAPGCLHLIDAETLHEWFVTVDA